MKYQIEVNVRKEREYNWYPLSPTNGDTYVFDSFDQAYRTADWLYPHKVYGEDVRITQLKENNNGS